MSRIIYDIFLNADGDEPFVYTNSFGHDGRRPLKACPYCGEEIVVLSRFAVIVNINGLMSTLPARTEAEALEKFAIAVFEGADGGYPYYALDAEEPPFAVYAVERLGDGELRYIKSFDNTVIIQTLNSRTAIMCRDVMNNAPKMPILMVAMLLCMSVSLFSAIMAAHEGNAFDLTITTIAYMLTTYVVLMVLRSCHDGDSDTD